jgi:IPT/TIG domain
MRSTGVIGLLLLACITRIMPPGGDGARGRGTVSRLLTPGVGDSGLWAPDVSWSMLRCPTASPPGGTVTEGLHTFEVKARDQAGNEDATPASASFTVAVGLAITALEPSSGPIGTLVTIRGSGFAATPAGNTVRFAASPRSSARPRRRP